MSVAINMKIAVANSVVRTIRPIAFSHTARGSSVLFSTTAVSQRLHKNQPDDVEDNKPVNFFGSKAATWRAKDTRSGGAEDVLWYQPWVISGSLAIFLLYFCVFREESDIDSKLEGNLFDKVEGLEEVQLTFNYKYNKERGLDVAAIEKRLKELGIDVSKL